MTLNRHDPHTSDSLLQRIITDKRRWIAARRQQQPLAAFRPDLQRSDRDFYHALRRVP